MSRTCLEEVCKFNSICTLGQDEKQIQADLILWWNSQGQQELFPSAAGKLQDDEAEGDSSEEEDEAAEAAMKTEAEQVEAEISSNIEAVEALACIEKDFEAAFAGKESEESFKDPFDEPADSTDEETSPEIAAKKAKTSDPPLKSIKTLADVLAHAGLQEFQIPEQDTEKNLFQRVRAMFPSMRSFGAFMRTQEGVLSKAAINGVTSKTRQHNLAEHSLALARASHCCSAMRQSRFALWAAFADKVVDAAEDSSVAAKIVKLGPPTEKDSEGVVKRQLLVVKPEIASSSLVNQLRFATPTSVWRVARKTVKAGRRYLPDSRFPASLIAQVQVMLLTPHETSKGSGVYRLRGSSLVVNILNCIFHYFPLLSICNYFLNYFDTCSRS